MATDTVLMHVNSEGESITVELVRGGAFAGQYLLVIHDDGFGGIGAPMLLDESTRTWLRKALDTTPLFARNERS